MAEPQTNVIDEADAPAVPALPEPPLEGDNPFGPDEAVLQYLQQSAQEPGDEQTQPGHLVADGSDVGAPFAAAVNSIESAGYVYVYDRRTGDRSQVNRNNLADTMKKTRCTRFCRGKACEHPRELVFTLQDPGIRPKAGKLLCRLHPEDPERATWDEYGLAHCDTDNLQNSYQLGRHMQRKHKEEWALIQSEQWAAEEAERRAEQQKRDDALFSLTAAGAKATRVQSRKKGGS